jgi:prepilin-type N-terminal cleavage/methylation domain-containing protein
MNTSLKPSPLKVVDYFATPHSRARCASRRPWHRQPRSAFTLIEVILALVILGGALAILGEVMQLANSSAVDARAETQAQLIANSVMDEIIAGVQEDSPVSRQPLEVVDATRWLYSVETGTSDIEGVYPLVVTVEQDLEARFNPVKFRLVRWMPTVPETSEIEEQATADRQDASREQGSGQTGGSGSAGGNGGAGRAGGAL